MSKTRFSVLALAAGCALGTAIFAANQNFFPDVVFKGSSLTGWHKLGPADWRADNGEIISAPKESGGWVMVDKGYQDIAFYRSVSFARARPNGGLLRAPENRRGEKGILGGPGG